MYWSYDSDARNDAVANAMIRDRFDEQKVLACE